MTETVPMINYIILAVCSYFAGNINPAIIIGRLHHIDIRKEGSGNPGMTNTIRVIGLKAGIAVFVIDFLKAFIAVRVGFNLYELNGAMVAFAAVVLGHCFPVVYKFKGGKGVAASLGAAIALNWMSAAAVLIVAAVLFGLSRRMSVASIGAAVSYPFFIWLYEPYCLYFAIGAAVFLVIKHIPNIKRLINGKEKPLTIGHSKDNSDDEDEDGADAEDGNGTAGTQEAGQADAQSADAINDGAANGNEEGKGKKTPKII